MKKKFIGKKIGKIISAIICLLVAIIFWFFVKYSKIDSSTAMNLITAFFRI